MSARRTLSASLLILAAGLAVLFRATGGFRAFTTETARRIDVREHPRTVPDVTLQTADGGRLQLGALHGRWVLVDFIYTRCQTYCTTMGSDFAQLQISLATPISKQQATLLSISFDLANDDPAHLAEYQRRSGDHGAGWIAARPINAAGLDSLTRVFSVTVVPDGLGGFVHNAAIAAVDPKGRLVAILDWNDPGAAARFISDQLAR